MKKIFLILLVTFAGFNLSKAQDTIVKKDGEMLKVKVTEIGTEEIKFKMTGVADSPIMALKKSEVKRVVVGGQVIINEKDAPVVKPKTEDLLVKQDGSVLKVNVIEIGTDEIKFRLAGDPDGPLISIDKKDIKTLKVGDQVVIDNKKESDDVISKKDGSILKVKVIDLGNDDVRFKLAGNPDGPTMTLKKKDIKTVKIDGQIVYEYKEDPYSTSNSAILDKTSDIKFEFFSPLFNHVAFSYEWMQKPGFNFEAGFGIIGAGVSKSNALASYITSKPTGFYIRGGPKFLLGSGSDIEIEGARISHPLKGRYFAIDVILNTMSEGLREETYTYNQVTGQSTTTVYNWNNRYQSFCLNLLYGRQNIYGKAMTVGYYIGIGYGFESITVSSGSAPPNSSTDPYYAFDPRRYSHVYAGRDFPLTITYGLTIGLIHNPIQSKGNKGKYTHNPHSQNDRSRIN